MNRRVAPVVVALVLLAGAAWLLTRPTEAPLEDSAEIEGVASPLPGAPPIDPALAAELVANIDEGPYRTRHLTEEGTPTYVNRLVLESSPYLRQHAHNPVNWYPWGDEAFAAAKALGRPILLSVGYATCHWCHVMEEESFEDEAVAQLINEHYIPVKVDREERPDIDAIYMTAVMGFTGGRGGWPMTLWLTPTGDPFYGATYVPPEDGMRGRPTGLKTMLTRLATLYAEEPEKVALTTASVRESIVRTLEAHQAPAELPDDADLALFTAVEDRYDAEHGGLVDAPKFPTHVPVRALLRGGEDPASMATHTLEAMASGGIYDHLGGGFHRYSVDATWTVPHFEKMLYDNALLAIAYTEAAQQSGDGVFTRVASETLDAMLADFALDDGAFAAALDADSLGKDGERHEGAYYTWTPDDLGEVLAPDRAKAFAETYGVTERGQHDGRSVLRTDGVLDMDAHADHAADREALIDARRKRPAPLRDDKVLAGHNGLAVSALARAGRAFGEPRYIEAAERAASAVWERQVLDGRVRRTWTPGGGAAHAGQLEDYAFLAAGFVDLFEATGERAWLERALALDESIQIHFADTETGGYFASPDDGETLLARKRAGTDAAVPSGASVHALTLLRLGEITGRDGYRDRAVALVQSQGEALTAKPLAYTELYLAVDWLLDTPREIVLIGEGDDAEALREVLREHFLPTAVLVDVTPDEARNMEDLTSLVRDRGALGGQATVYVCEGGVCQQPVSDPETLREQLRAK